MHAKVFAKICNILLKINVVACKKLSDFEVFTKKIFFKCCNKNCSNYYVFPILAEFFIKHSILYLHKSFFLSMVPTPKNCQNIGQMVDHVL